MCNIYAPHQNAEKEQFYDGLQSIEFVKDDTVLVGGDFNCTLDDKAGRTYHGSTQGHDSPALTSLLPI